MAVSPFKINIPDQELDLLSRKLELARIDPRMATEQWAEDNGVTYQFMKDTVDFWRTKYNWRDEEARLNRLPQFKTTIEIEGFGTLDAHFVHSKASTPNAIPLLFSHGWPGSFAEVEKILTPLNEAGFDVVAPSLPGYGFSSFTDKAGFGHQQTAEFLHSIMRKLGYEHYVVQGGDWGSFLVRTMAITYPDHVKAMHVNMIIMHKPPTVRDDHEYTSFEQRCLDRISWFMDTNADYNKIQWTKPRTLGFGFHDSPVAMLAWMADKLFIWSDSYPWTPTELITWTLLHYFNSPTTAMHMYKEISPPVEYEDFEKRKVTIPCGASAFPKELGIVPRCWAEAAMNVQFWQEHERGGHFAAYEKPSELSGDMIQFFKSVWRP